MSTASGQEPQTIPLPPVPQAAPRRRRPWGDYFLTLLVLLLAFLTASSLARNSDLWFHLATGRLIAEGRFPFGADPFAFTTGGVYWACHSWLFDLGLYELFDRAGGAPLVVLKALLVTALAGLLLLVRRPGSRAGLPVVCTALALLAMSPRLLVQPACVSYLFLGAAFWLLWTQHEGRHAKLCRGLLLLACVAWVNVDEWFLLGPVLTALFWLGERLAGQRRTPGWLVVAAAAVCLANPYTYHAFTPPAELSPVTWTGGLREDPRFQALFASPWAPANLPIAAHHPALPAYFALTLLGLGSFLLNRQAMRGWRFVVWLPFALLAAWQARAIPFFAVVAAPITVLNGQDFLAGRAARRNRPSFLLAPARFLLALALVAAAGLTWLGWSITGSRQVAWEVQPDSSLRRAAEALRRGERVFALSPEVAQYGAWLAPGAKFFFDHRYQLFGGTARDYESACRGLLGGSDENWRRVLRDNGVRLVAYSDHDAQRLFPVLRRVAEEPAEWTLLDVAGQAVLVGWKDGGADLPPAFDAERLAFGAQDEAARRALPPAPERGPNPLSPPRDFRSRATRLLPPPAWESSAATLYLHYADDSEAAQRQRQIDSSLRAYAASLAGLPALPAGGHQAVAQLVSSANLLFPPQGAPSFVVREQLGPFFAHLVQRSPALPLLAVRAARRAVAADPEDANAWLRLGQAYALLRTATGEGSAHGLLPPLSQMRHVQIATALEQAVRLDPHLESAHAELARLYGERGYLDASLDHARDELRLSRKAGPQRGESREEFEDRIDQMDKDTAKLVQMVEQARKVYAVQSRRLEGNRLAQADLALQLGLARKAADEILLQSPADVLGGAGMRLELDVLLCLGRADEVRPTLDDEVMRANRQTLYMVDLIPPRAGGGGFLYAIPYHWPAYEWLHALQSAALGDYAEAREEVRAVRSGLKAARQRVAEQRRLSGDQLWQFTGGLLAGPPPFLPLATAGILGPYLENRAALQVGVPALRGQQADLCVLVGLLALELGDTAAARAAFAEAEALCAAPGDTVPFAGAPIVALYLGKFTGRE
ncbi:MAG TPA: hypothetical protein VFW33_05620 [Gemmataceae bacterium]|nr:hypothetical protein [Gemmataceae bacterium]